MTQSPRQSNPFRPGFNQAPGVLAGRDEVLAAVGEALDVAALDARTPTPLVLVGSRGVGKTVLLGAVAELAAERHAWLTIAVEVRPDLGFVPQLIDRLQAGRELLDAAPSGRFTLDSLTARLGISGTGIEGELRRERPAGPHVDLLLERTLVDVCEFAVQRGTGIVITVDEAHLAGRAGLGELAATLQQHVAENWPLVVVLAGLPSLRDPGRAITYLERAEWHEIGLLDPADTALALVGPAEDAGRPMTDEALDILVAASGGYPFAVQLLGHHAWRASTGGSTIDADSARAAVPAADRALSDGLYAQRWADASGREREYLQATARVMLDDGSASGSQVAAALGATTPEVSYLRQRLLKKGTLVAVGRDLRFPVPGMAAWIRDET
ncbi:MAG: AAA family ATPase [Acidimicrobiia bacterium]|nr:AAA family ATPase [Acidimicrobiia bacterium]